MAPRDRGESAKDLLPWGFMNLSRLRWLLQRTRIAVRLTSHARIEAIKDGLTEADLRYTLEYGEQIEDYPERARALLLGWTRDQIPCHIIVEWDAAASQAIIVSAYVPNRQDWYPDWKRRRRRKRP
jgi:hypothetical protein